VFAHYTEVAIMYKWNLNVAMTGTHDYFVATAGSKANTTHRNCGKVNQNKTSIPPDEPLVLVVDDCADDRSLISRALLQADFRVAEAATGEEAIKVFLEMQPQVVVLDLLMPCVGGLSVCRMLRAEPGGDDLKILMFSGLTDVGTKRRSFDAGANEFLEKPGVGADFSLMVERVRNLVFNSAPGTVSIYD
jgi:CheY-like chemotaxis protein